VQHLADLVCGHVLPLPAKGVTNAVHKIKEALLINLQQVPRAPPHVSLLEYTMIQLLSGDLFPNVPVVHSIGKFKDNFPRLICSTFLTKPSLLGAEKKSII